MAKYFYSVKANNKIEQGYINAATMSDAASELEYKGYVVLEINEVFSTKNSDLSQEVMPLSIKEKKDFFNSFYVQYKSGRTPIQVFETIANSATSENVKMLALHICHKVTKGISFGDAFRQYSDSIGFLYTNIICVGDKSGKLEDVLAGIIKNLSKLEKINSEIIKKITYPLIVFMLLIAAFIIFNSFIFKILHETVNGESVSICAHLLATIFQIFVVYTLLFISYQHLKRNKALVSLILDKLTKNKAINEMLNDYYYFNFFHLLSMCIVAGISPKDSILMCASVVKNHLGATKLDKAGDRVSQGCNMSTALISTGLFSEYANSQVSAGEKAGELEKAFGYIANDYEIKFNTQISVVLKLIEPIMIVIAGIGLLILGYNFYQDYYESLYKLF
ncbi:MAG: type II secretion system F family protein [Candidatus Gastranaerophilales bacterium]|nr:type II secretion system F family protein [Candidatus Gastranaerophilales bacterium]